MGSHPHGGGGGCRVGDGGDFDAFTHTHPFVAPPPTFIVPRCVSSLDGNPDMLTASCTVGSAFRAPRAAREIASDHGAASVSRPSGTPIVGLERQTHGGNVFQSRFPRDQFHRSALGKRVDRMPRDFFLGDSCWVAHIQCDRVLTSSFDRELWFELSTQGAL